MRITSEENRVIEEALNVLGPTECINRFAKKYASAVAVIRDAEASMSPGKIRLVHEELGALRVALETMVQYYGEKEVDKYTGQALDRLRLKVRLEKINEPIHNKL